jgi:hypothetical protein
MYRVLSPEEKRSRARTTVTILIDAPLREGLGERGDVLTCMAIASRSKTPVAHASGPNCLDIFISCGGEAMRTPASPQRRSRLYSPDYYPGES